MVEVEPRVAPRPEGTPRAVADAPPLERSGDFRHGPSGGPAALHGRVAVVRLASPRQRRARPPAGFRRFEAKRRGVRFGLVRLGPPRRAIPGYGPTWPASGRRALPAVRDLELAEAPGSRTQPPRVGGGRPILKTGRATGPRSLPRRLGPGVHRTAGDADRVTPGCAAPNPRPRDDREAAERGAAADACRVSGTTAAARNGDATVRTTTGADRRTRGRRGRNVRGASQNRWVVQAPPRGRAGRRGAG